MSQGIIDDELTWVQEKALSLQAAFELMISSGKPYVIYRGQWNKSWTLDLYDPLSHGFKTTTGIDIKNNSQCIFHFDLLVLFP